LNAIFQTKDKNDDVKKNENDDIENMISQRSGLKRDSKQKIASGTSPVSRNLRDFIEFEL